jgi:hypothetical protein
MISTAPDTDVTGQFTVYSRLVLRKTASRAAAVFERDPAAAMPAAALRSSERESRIAQLESERLRPGPDRWGITGAGIATKEHAATCVCSMRATSRRHLEPLEANRIAGV